MTRIRAAAGRYRFGRAAAVVVALYLTAAAVAVVLAAVSGDLSALSTAATARVWITSEQAGRPGPVLIGMCGLNAWMLWQVLRGPALPRAGGSPSGVVWLRRLLYVNVAGDLVLRELLDEVSDTAEDVASALVWAATVILLTRVVSGVSAGFRAIALALGLIGVLAPLPMSLIDGTDLQTVSLLGLASFGWTVMILIAQRRDGRWSDATVDIGRIALIAPLLFPLLNLASQSEWLFFDGAGLLMSALGVFGTVWLARTAHELAGPAGTPAPRPDGRPAPQPTPGRGPWLFVAVALVLPLVVIDAEDGALLRVAGAGERCREQVRSHGGPADASELDTALESPCPDVIARRAEEAREQARREREEEREWAAWKAGANARCADPWPRLRAGRQGTAAYLLSEGGGYAVHDDRDGTEGPDGDIFEAVRDGFIDAAGSSAAITTHGENAPMCLTVKAFDAAPPLRLKGWDRVVEVGLLSRSGRLVVPSYREYEDGGAIGPLPHLAVDGPGRYRVRVYARAFERDEDDPDAPVEEHLIVVYPGRSAEKVVHRR
ncbi:hypothetical protein [Planobispora takensis]|uniref:Uncharacterized protein n=1 Tax=Planobispora takensis TaxID=1367882 RepID=A0A8J3T0G2_9ACTN|nr:hypothetical protein [Planobispora takensis]GII04034.1 hypothetical protein Pta02_60420 [Planobispora takensis]